jgi:REP element-mobilizing transposase RayT
MASQSRHNVEGGWYHITTREIGRRESDYEERLTFNAELSRVEPIKAATAMRSSAWRSASPASIN